MLQTPNPSKRKKANLQPESVPASKIIRQDTTHGGLISEKSSLNDPSTNTTDEALNVEQPLSPHKKFSSSANSGLPAVVDPLAADPPLIAQNKIIEAEVLPSAHASDTAVEGASSSKFSFYLHSPSLPSRLPVLIPLSANSTLAVSLSNRLVLEFPTVYVFHRQPDDKLPGEYINEKDYYNMAKKELIEEVGREENSVGIPFVGQVKADKRLEEGEVDENRLLEVLGKDLNGVKGPL